MSTSSQNEPAQTQAASPLSVEHVDLLDATEKIAASDPELAELLTAVHELDAEAMHTVTESDGECVDDCPPCVAMYAARVVAAKALGGAR